MVWSVGSDGKTVVNAGFGVFLNQWAYSVQQSLASALPFFFAKTVNAAADALQPAFTTGNILLANANGTIGGSTMNHDFQTEYAKNWSASVQRQLTPTTMIEASVLRSAIVGADSSTVLNVPTPGPGAIGPRRPVPQLANITAIRWDRLLDLQRLHAPAEQRLSRGLAFSANYSLSKAVDDASDPGATVSEANLPQDVRNMAAERAVSSFDHRHRFVANATWALPAVGRRDRFQQAHQRDRDAAVRRAVHGQSRHRPGEHRLGPGAAAGTSTAIRTSAAPGLLRSGSTPACSLCPRRSPSATRDATPCWARATRTSMRACRRTSRLAARVWSLRWEIFNLLNSVNFDVPESGVRHLELRPHLQRAAGAADAVRGQGDLLKQRWVLAFAVGLLAVLGIAGARYVMRGGTDGDERGLPRTADSLKGDVARTSDGKLHYFDGRQWTDTPLPATDLPFESTAALARTRRKSSVRCVRV